MATDSEWFQGRGVDEHDLAYWGRVFAELACFLLIGVLVAGCSSLKTEEPESKVCFMALMGRTDSGLSVVRQACFTEEQFAEMQK